MKEEWRDIKGYEGKYQVSNLGRVKSLNYNRTGKENILSSTPDKGGYLIVNLYKKGKRRGFSVHKLVALHFIPNLNNFSEVNHKDENKSNNCVENLEWCDRKYNVNYGTRNKRDSEKKKGKNKGSNHGRARKVQCITTGKVFDCIQEAGRYYLLSDSGTRNITYCCQGKRKSAGKHPDTGEKLVWEYID